MFGWLINLSLSYIISISNHKVVCLDYGSNCKPHYMKLIYKDKD